MNFQQHQWVGDNFDENDQMNHIFFTLGKNFMSFGEVNGLAGDHFDPVKKSVPGKNIDDSELDAFIGRMMKGVLQYRGRVNVTIHARADDKYENLSKIRDPKLRTLATIDKKLYRSLALLTSEHVEITLKNYQKEMDIRAAVTTYDLQTGIGDYVMLARSNWHHFMPLCWWVYDSLHKKALSKASEVSLQIRKKFKPSGSRKDFCLDKKKETSPENKFARAMFWEACACHYLEDCFAGGHLRTLRIFYGTLVDAVFDAKTTHAKDNDAQINFTNLLTKKMEKPGKYWWGSTGERNEEHFFPDGAWIKDNQDHHLRMVRRSVATSVLQLFDIPENLKGEKLGTKLRSLQKDVAQYIPQMSSYWVPVKDPFAKKVGYDFYEGQLHWNSCVLHIDLGYNQPGDPHQAPPYQVIVADVSDDGPDIFSFYQRGSDGKYELKISPSVHREPEDVQRKYFPCTSKKYCKYKFRYYPPDNISYDDKASDEIKLEENTLVKKMLEEGPPKVEPRDAGVAGGVPSGGGYDGGSSPDGGPS